MKGGEGEGEGGQFDPPTPPEKLPSKNPALLGLSMSDLFVTTRN